jgi:protein TonB
MVTKKSKKSNLENKKTIFFEIGMVMALSIALVAFEWSTTESPGSTLLTDWDDTIEEELEIDITRPEIEQKIKPPPPMPLIVIVDNTLDIPEPEFEIDIEIDPNGGYFIPPLEDEPPVTDDPIFFPQEWPKYRNGERINFRNHMQQIVDYPQEAINLRLEGTVFVNFVVNKQGEVSNITIARGIDPLLDYEVIAAIQQSEKWKPGRQNGLPVSVAMTMPIVFRLQ